MGRAGESPGWLSCLGERLDSKGRGITECKRADEVILTPRPTGPQPAGGSRAAARPGAFKA